MYKDKDRQREANRRAAKEHRERHNKAIESMTNKGMTVVNEQPNVILSKVIPKRSKDIADKSVEFVTAKGVVAGIPAINKPKRGKDIKCFEDLPPDVQQTIDRMSMVGDKIDQTIKAKRTAIAIDYQHQFPDRYNCSGCCISTSERVVIGKPGDTDYNGICTSEWRAERGR